MHMLTCIDLKFLLCLYVYLFMVSNDNGLLTEKTIWSIENPKGAKLVTLLYKINIHTYVHKHLYVSICIYLHI